MAEDDLRRLLDYLLEEARQRGTRHVAGGKMTMPQSFEGPRKSNSAPVSRAHQLTGFDLDEWLKPRKPEGV